MELVERLTSTRRGTLALAALAALLAGAAVLVYLNNYRHSLNSGATPTTVLVAKQLIAKGTPGAAVATTGMFQTTTLRESQVLNGAISDPSSLRGRVAAHDVYPGQQLTTADFVAGETSAAGALTKTQRLISIPLDSSHGLIGQVASGDHVDVFAGFNVIPVDARGVPLQGGQARPVLKLIMQNVPVVDVTKNAQGNTSNVSLKVDDRDAADLAFASDNGKLWIVLRPPSGAKPVAPSFVTAETLLLGVPPVVAQHSFGARR